MPSAISTIFLVFAVTISFLYGSIFYGLLFFVLALANEFARMWALRSPTTITYENE